MESRCDCDNDKRGCIVNVSSCIKSHDEDTILPVVLDSIGEGKDPDDPLELLQILTLFTSGLNVGYVDWYCDNICCKCAILERES